MSMFYIICTVNGVQTISKKFYTLGVAWQAMEAMRKINEENGFPFTYHVELRENKDIAGKVFN